MKNHRKIFIIIGVLFSNYLFTMEWPIQDGNPVSNFGWNDSGQAALGNIFEGNGEITAIDNGELIFFQFGYNSASRLPAPLGSWIALDHTEGGLISIYSRISNEKISIPNFIEKDMVLGMAGRSGWSNRQGVYFSLFDRKERRWVNPAMIVSPLQDTRAPIIHSVMLQNAERRSFDLAQVRNISQGRYSISAVVTDTRLSPNENPLAPYRITCVMNGIEVGTLNFETYSSRDGVLMVHRNGLVPVKQVYAPIPGFEIGEILLTRGQVILDIIAYDIAGNSQSIQYRLQID